MISYKKYLYDIFLSDAPKFRYFIIIFFYQQLLNINFRLLWFKSDFF